MLNSSETGRDQRARLGLDQVGDGDRQFIHEPTVTAGADNFLAAA